MNRCRQEHPIRRVLYFFCVVLPTAALFLSSILLPAPALAETKDTIVFGVDQEYSPYESITPEGILEGFNIDMTRAIGRIMGFEPVFRPAPWPEVRKAVENGSIDAVSGMFFSPERDAVVDFTAPHIIVYYSVFVRKGSHIESIEDIRESSVIVQEMDIMDDILTRQDVAGEIVRVVSQIEALRLLASGEHDAAVLSQLQGEYHIKRLGLKNLTSVGFPVYPQEYCMAVPEGRSEVLERLNEGLRILKATGEYREIRDKWFSDFEDKPGSFNYRIAGYAALPLLVLLLLAVLWNWSLKRRVSEATGEMAQELAMRRKAEQELRGVRNYIRNIIDSMPSLLMGVDEYGYISQWNAAARDFTGIPETEAKGELLARIMPDFREPLLELARVIREGKPYSVKKFVVKGTEGVRFWDILIYPLTGDGDKGAVVRIDDATERARLEDMVVQTEKMVSVGGLAAGMAHEINNPLGGILQGVQNVLRRTDPGIEANIRTAEEVGCTLDTFREYMEKRRIFRFLEGIRESGERASNIVANMLEFSRRSESSRQPVDIHRTIEKSINLAGQDYDLKKRYDFKQISIIRDFQLDDPIITATETELEQVFLNLLRNAAQAMGDRPPEGRPVITLRTLPADGDIRIIVEDNGPGMPDEIRRRVFEPFFTTKPVGVGTGLGLSVSYFIITKNHGGHIVVESEQGLGTSFTITLPRTAL